MTLRESMDHSKALDYAQLIEACACYVRETKPALRDPLAVYRLMVPLFRYQKQESVYIILTDSKNRVIGAPREITRGLIDSCPTHAREVFRQAITDSASAIILCHNHPSGDPTPSREDIEATRRLVETGRIVGIPIFDHVIIGNRFDDDDRPYISMRELNLVSFTASLKENNP
jgi:DNA repair protein RadC